LFFCTAWQLCHEIVTPQWQDAWCWEPVKPLEHCFAPGANFEASEAPACTAGAFLYGKLNKPLPDGSTLGQTMAMARHPLKTGGSQGIGALAHVSKERQMNTNKADHFAHTPTDPDLREQAQPGHGVPSQDPEDAAQVGLTPEEAARETKSSWVGGGVIAGVAAGAATGAAVGGPVGVVVGSAVGAVAGALGGSAAGAAVKPDQAQADADTETRQGPK
jgi:uncharacterized protein YcfJ